MFLNKEIQTSNQLGHDASEDACATLQLAQLKLQFGEWLTVSVELVAFDTFF